MARLILGDLAAGDAIDVANNKISQYSKDNLQSKPRPLTQPTAQAASALFPSGLNRQESLKSALKKRASNLITTSLSNGSLDNDALNLATSNGSGTSSNPTSPSKSVTFAPKDILHEVPCHLSARYLYYDDDKNIHMREVCSKWFEGREAEWEDWLEEKEEEEDLDEEECNGIEVEIR